MRTSILLFALVSLASPAFAQVVGKVPPAPAVTPEYTPPAPAPVAPPAPPAEPEPDAPSLIERDAAGKLVLLTVPADERAVAVYPFKPDRREKLNASIATRHVDLERWVVDHLEQVQTALTSKAELDQVTDFNQLFRAKQAVDPLKQEPLLDRLQRDSAITPAQRSQMEKVIAEYVAARRDEWERATGTDIMKIATFTGQQGFADITHPTFAALDRLIGRAAVELRAGSHGLELKPDQARALAAALPGDPAAATVTPILRGFVMTTLTPEQREALLRKQLPVADK